METVAQLILAGLVFGSFKAYLQHGSAGVRKFWRSKLIGDKE